jgi:CheY-like chemotaxis protein
MNPNPDISDHPARILIVDDERHNRQLLEVMLKPEGHCLLTAASGEEALALVAQHPPDVILLDIMMPGMDGYEVTSKLKGNRATKNISGSCRVVGASEELVAPQGLQRLSGSIQGEAGGRGGLADGRSPP